jgi:hypothetical protein
MTIHAGLDLVAIATFGVYTETYGSGGMENICNLYATFGFLENINASTVSNKLRRYIRMVMRV